MFKFPTLQSLFPSWFITEAHAIKLGLTHEGTVYGIPSWITDHEADVVVSVPKFYPARHLMDLMDGFVHFMMNFFYDDMVYEVPIKIKRKLGT